MSELKKINRVLICNVTGKEITVKPDKYEKLYTYYDQDEDKVSKSFICYSVEKEARSPSFEFWISNCKETNKLIKELKKIFTTFKDSKRENKDVVILQNESFDLFDKLGINKHLIEFLQESDDKGNYVKSIKLKNIPFIKTKIFEII